MPNNLKPQPRQSIVEMFSSFLQFRESKNVWIPQAKLRRSMEEQLNNHTSPPTTGNFWALYWYKIWDKQPQTIAREHLYAYLQETAYKAAYDRAQKVHPSQRWDKLQEYFQVVFKNQIYERVLKKFDSEYGSDLAAFALPIFKNSINEELRQRNKAASHSDWSLLRHTTDKLLKKALQNHGLSEQDIESYLLLRDCFRKIYHPETPKANKQLSCPELETFQTITQTYNQERLGQLSNSGTKLNLNDIEVRLKEIAQAIRNYYAPVMISLNNPLSQEGVGEIQDIIPSSETESLLENLIREQEELNFNKLWQEINCILEEFLAKKLTSEQKKYFQLYYGVGLTQAEIAEKLLGEIKKQYTISRKMNKTCEQIVKVLVNWANNKKTHNLKSDNIVGNVDILLKEWLQKYYAN